MPVEQAVHVPFDSHAVHAPSMVLHSSQAGVAEFHQYPLVQFAQTLKSVLLVWSQLAIGGTQLNASKLSVPVEHVLHVPLW